ncbi:MAG: XTP/dITP diphosphatase [Fusobacteriales bacterium]|jgi:XTP/dITP diphosphohydrolase|nr:XTP/dITP diphosphatase [Fusobacteriales bacterium]
MKIFLATKNIGKINEFKRLVDGKNIEVLSILDSENIPEVEEDGETFEENSRKKAVETAKYLNLYTISDDSGLCVNYLDGAPGVYSARYSGENSDDSKNMDKLLKDLEGVNDRAAKFVSVVSLAKPDGSVYSYRGEADGEIMYKRHGTNGFGYDPIFFSHELNKCFGEASPEEKKSVSHRAKAFEKLMKDIDSIIK